MNRAPEDDTVHACPDAAGAGREDRSIPMRRESALSSASYCGMEADLLSGGSSDAWSVGQLAPSPGLTRYSAFDLRVRDRKSTRLNSSHVAISYAVFCLKK